MPFFHPDIELEVQASYEWYQKQAVGLGDDFLIRVIALLYISFSSIWLVEKRRHGMRKKRHIING